MKVHQVSQALDVRKLRGPYALNQSPSKYPPELVSLLLCHFFRSFFLSGPLETSKFPPISVPVLELSEANNIPLPNHLLFPLFGTITANRLRPFPQPEGCWAITNMFWQGRSTGDLLALACCSLSDALDNHEEIQLVPLNSSRALGQVWHYGQQAKLPPFGFILLCVACTMFSQ